MERTDLMFMVVVWMEVKCRGVAMWVGVGWGVGCYGGSTIKIRVCVSGK